MNISRICFPCNQPTSIITPIKKTVKGINVKAARTVASWGQKNIQITRKKLMTALPTKNYLFHCHDSISTAKMKRVLASQVAQSYL